MDPALLRHPASRAGGSKRDPLFGNGGVDFEQVEHLVTDEDPDTALCGVDQRPLEPGLAALRIVPSDRRRPDEPGRPFRVT